MDFRAFEATPGIRMIMLPDTPVFTIIAVSNDFIRASGLKREAVIGIGHFSFLTTSPDDLNSTAVQNLKESFDNVLQHKKPHAIPFQRYDTLDDDGSFTQKYWMINNVPLLSDTGEVLYIIHSANDITDQILAEQKAESTKGIEKAYHLFMNAPVIFGIMRGDNYVIEIANEELLRVWGRTAEVVGKPLMEALPELAEQGFTDLLDQVSRTGESFHASEYPVTLNRQGIDEVLYFDFVYKPFYENQKVGKVTGVSCVGHEVTDQVMSRMKIEESNKDFQFVTDFVPQMIWVTRADGYHYYYNKQWYDFTGLTYDKTKGEGWNGVFHPDDQEHAWQLWRHSLATGEPYEIEYRCRRYDGEYRWVLGRALPLKDESGTILKWFGTCTDIHDQVTEAQVLGEIVEERTKELQKANQELQRSNNNLEEFAHAASHDMKEPIRKVLTFMDRLRTSMKEHLTEKEKDIFSKVEHATERMGLLVDDLLEFSLVSERPMEKEVVDLKVNMQHVLADLELLIEEKKAQIKISTLPTVNGYKRQLQQLLQNLIGNALKYSKPNQAPVINISSKVMSSDDIADRVLPHQLNQQFSLIEVKDNGIGFEPEYAERIFGMFQRLHGKAEYPGTGVGLSIARKVVENHNGYIWAESQLGEGATFKILLPAN